MANIWSSFATIAGAMYQRGKMFKEISNKSLSEIHANDMNTRTEMIEETYTACPQESTLQASSRMSNLVSKRKIGRSKPSEDEREVHSMCDESLYEVIDPKQKHVALDFWKNKICFW